MAVTVGSTKMMGVVGLLVVNPKFRTDFFNNPVDTAEAVFPSLTAEEKEQLQWLAGNRRIPNNRTRDAYVQDVMSAANNMYAELDCSCPSPPCPCPFSADLYS
jgi:hypothetical protein